MELDTETNAVVPGDSEQPSAPTTSEGQDRQPAAAPPNWNNDPEFKKWQAAQDRRYDEARRSAEETRQHNLRIQQELEAIRVANMDDEERRAYEFQKVRGYTSWLEQELARRDQDREKDQDVNELSQLFGVQAEELKQFNKYNEAVKYAAQKAKEAEDARIKEAVERTLKQLRQEEPDEVDLGQSLPRTPATDRQKALEKAKASGNVTEYIKLRMKG